MAESYWRNVDNFGLGTFDLDDIDSVDLDNPVPAVNMRDVSYDHSGESGQGWQGDDATTQGPAPHLDEPGTSAETQDPASPLSDLRKDTFNLPGGKMSTDCIDTWNAETVDRWIDMQELMDDYNILPMSPATREINAAPEMAQLESPFSPIHVPLREEDPSSLTTWGDLRKEKATNIQVSPRAECGDDSEGETDVLGGQSKSEPVPTVIQVGPPEYWTESGMDMSVNPNNPGSFGTHSWLKAHTRRMRTKTSELTTCSLCAQVFGPKAFRAHLDMTHKVRRNLLTPCFICEKLVSVLHLNMHLSSMHRVSPTLTAGSGLPLGLGHDHMIRTEIVGENKCTLCDNRFFSTAELRQHHKIVHPSADASHACWMCPKFYKTQAALANHMYRNHQHDCWRCSFCHEGFRYKKGLRNHLSMAHDDPEIRKCFPCGIEFSHMLVYSRHVKEEHAGRGYFRCMICGTDFESADDFKTHVCPLSR